MAGKGECYLGKKRRENKGWVRGVLAEKVVEKKFREWRGSDG